MVYRFYQIYIKFSSLSHFLHHLQLRFTMFGLHIYHGGYLSDLHVSPIFDLIFSLLVLLNMIRSVSPLHVPYHLGSPCLVHTSWCVHVSQAFVTWPWPHFHGLLTLLNLHQVYMIRPFSPLPYKLGSQSLIHTFIIVCACQAGRCHLTLTSYRWSVDFVKFE
jgi:hypothetical protein